MPSAQQRLAGASARGASIAEVRRRQHRTPWYARKRFWYPLFALLVFFGTLGVLAWNIEITDPFTGKKQPIGQQVRRATENILNPRLSLNNAFDGQRLVTFLLVGLDHVPERKGESALRRSDSMLVATTDFSTKQIRLLSIPRDSWCEMLDGDRLIWNRLGHSYAIGQSQDLNDPAAGIKNTRDAISRLLTIEPQYYVVIQFEGLASVVDALGGLDVDVEKNMNYDDRHGNLHIHFKKGLQHMTGQQVVEYARFRHDMMGDITRMERQQKVIRLILEKAMALAASRKPQDLMKLKNVAALLAQNVQTNLTLDQLLALAQHVDDYSPASLQTKTLQSYGPQDDQYPASLRGNTNGMAVQALLPADVEAGRQFLLDLNPPPPPAPPAAEGASPAEGESAQQWAGTGDKSDKSGE